MKRALVSAAVVLVLASGARPAAAASNPVINVDTFGLELCPQSICGAAIFVGVLFGEVGGNQNAFGTYSVAITHDPLPPAFHFAALKGGLFEFKVGLRRIRGIVTGGVLFNNGNNTFSVRANLLLLSGGTGTVVFEGLLDHNVFPPTVVGRVRQ